MISVAAARNWFFNKALETHSNAYRGLEIGSGMVYLGRDEYGHDVIKRRLTMMQMN